MYACMHVFILYISYLFYHLGIYLRIYLIYIVFIYSCMYLFFIYHIYFLCVLFIYLSIYFLYVIFILSFTYSFGGPGNSVGIATAYGLDDPGIESRLWGDIFRTCPDRSLGPPSLLYKGYRVFPGGKLRPGRDADPSPPSSTEVKNRVELYLYSFFGPSWPVKG